MSGRKKMIVDGNGAVSHIAHATNEVIAIYPITPSSPMGETCDEKTAKGEKNIWGTVPKVIEMQSEAGAVGAVHGALTIGAMTTTFTASQGLLLMIPNMYKIAGELTPTVFHIAARSIATQALNIFGDHSDVMACRMTGWAFLASSNVQEAEDFALISEAATLEARVPFIHFFEGFRVSHEIQKIEEVTFDDIKQMIDNDLVKAHRKRGLTPSNPMIKGTSQNPDVFFQGREVSNKYYNMCPSIVQKYMDKFKNIIGREYHLFDYFGDKDAENIIIVMGSGAEVVEETINYLNKNGEKLGLIKVRLFRPFSVKDFIKAVPKTVKKIAVLDRTKEPGSLGEPLYEDIRTAFGEAIENGDFKGYPKIIGGRFGLGSAEFTPSMVKAIFDNLKLENPKNHFTVGITDDLTNTSLEYDKNFYIDDEDTYEAMFYGLGSDGTVGANKNSIKIIASKTDNYAQGYFEYDSKKAGAMTVSHLRFGKNPIKSPYLITRANFIACHNFSFLEKYDMLSNAKENGTFLLISIYNKNEVWNHIPNRVKKQILDKNLKFYIIDANKIAREVGLGSRVNVIMQTAFFEISKVIDPNIAIEAIKEAIKKTYGKKGDAVVNMNISAVDKAVLAIENVDLKDKTISGEIEKIEAVPENAPSFVKNLTAKLLKKEGTNVKTSEMPVDGTWPSGTTKYEKRNIASNIPSWNPEDCIQCGRCSLVCSHGAIRMKIYDEKELSNAPKDFKSKNAIGKNMEGKKCTIQVFPEDCTECGLCMSACPLIKPKEALKWVKQEEVREKEIKNLDFFLSLPETDKNIADRNSVKGSQLITPLFEFSGACAGCGETAYIKLLTQLFGDRLTIANATGCSSIYGGNLPTTPYTKNEKGFGPAWSNSLFEDNAEFALGMRVAYDKYRNFALELIDKILNRESIISDDEHKIISDNKNLFEQIKNLKQNSQDDVDNARDIVSKIKNVIKDLKSFDIKQLYSLLDYLVKKSVWAIGGDGWAYDIGYGGLDHVLASGENVKILVLDTEVYSNTGGQASKSTPMGAVAKFAASGKKMRKKDLAMIAMSYGYIYTAKVSIGADPNQLIKAMNEAENYNGPALIIAYAHCVAHGINMSNGLEEQKKAVLSGHWQLFRYNPALANDGKNPLQLDSKAPTIDIKDYVYGENRYKILQKMNPKESEKLIEKAGKLAKEKYDYLKKLTEI